MLEQGDTAAMRRALDDRSLDALLHPPLVAIVGAPNVGKSTLANQLFGRERSITADLPGTTRDWVGEQANLNGLVVTLVDTPGVRETADPIESEAILRSRGVIDQAAMVIEVLDATAPAPPAFPDADLLVVNKCDRLPDADADADADGEVLRISAQTGAGISAIIERALQHFGCHQLVSAHARCWTARQRALLRDRLA